MEEIWNEQTYQELLKELSNEADSKYRDFHSGLGVDKTYLLGVRTPILKKIAKRISKTNYQRFLSIVKHDTYEERLLHGLLIGYIPEPFSTIQQLLWDYIPYIDNWDLCDLTVSNLHIWKKYLPEGFSFVKICLKRKNTWYRRVGFVLLLSYYIEDDYISLIFSLCTQYQTDDYYVNMAIAWLLSICYIKQKEKTTLFLKDNSLSAWIQNKTIQKIRESNRISKIEKEELLKWKKQS